MSAAAQILDIEQPGDRLSPSSLNKYCSCSAKYYFGKVEKLPDPPTGAAALGAAVHHAIGASFAEKVETRQDLPLAGVLALYRDGWAKKVAGKLDREDGLPVEFRDDEIPDELRKQGEALVTLYMEQAAPKIQPVIVETHVSGRIGGVFVHGYLDLLDDTGRIVDLKTAARKPSEVSADYRMQVATYTQLTPGATGQARVDTLTKTKSPALVSQEFQVGQADVDACEHMYPTVQRAIRAGIYVPNRQSNLCSRKYCAFWRACERTYGGTVNA